MKSNKEVTGTPKPIYGLQEVQEYTALIEVHMMRGHWKMAHEVMKRAAKELKVKRKTTVKLKDGKTPLANIGLSEQLTCLLEYERFLFVEDLTWHSKDKIRRINGLGTVRFLQIEKAVESSGFDWPEEGRRRLRKRDKTGRIRPELR